MHFQLNYNSGNESGGINRYKNDLLEILESYSNQHLLPNISFLLNVLVTTATPKRTFSTLKTLKITYGVQLEKTDLLALFSVHRSIDVDREQAIDHISYEKHRNLVFFIY